MPLPDRVCVNPACARTYTPIRAEQRYCTSRCRSEHSNVRVQERLRREGEERGRRAGGAVPVEIVIQGHAAALRAALLALTPEQRREFLDSLLKQIGGGE